MNIEFLIKKTHHIKQSGKAALQKFNPLLYDSGFFCNFVSALDCFSNSSGKDRIVESPLMIKIMRNEKELEGVTLLGNQGTKYPTDYAPQLLETFENKHPENEYVVRLDCPEFTTLCPKTGQPDFGHIKISYIPRTRMVESKSLKLYLFSFRNHGDFHEDCVNIIMKDLRDLMDPRYIEVKGLFMPRGGISIHPFANWGDAEHEELAKQRRISQLEF